MNTVDLQDLKKIVSPEIPTDHASKPTQKLDAKGRAYATGKRKTAIARLWLKSGSGKITINDKDVKAYFGQSHLNDLVDDPFRTIGAEGRFDVLCTVRGSGLSSQAGAVRHALAKALCLYKTDSRMALKQKGFLTRDSRVVERKKPGQPKARKRFQFSKR